MASSSVISGVEPAVFIIFGITGDLSQRKLLPALYHLVKQNLLSEHTAIVGVSRRAVKVEEILNTTELCVNEQEGTCDPEVVGRLRKMFTMVQLDLTDGDDYERLGDILDKLDAHHGVALNRLFYLSIPPQVYSPIVRLLGTRLINGSHRQPAKVNRLLIEKPFGYDLTSAKELIEETGKYFHEEQIFRIDHYVAKETVQNILAFRFYNPLFQSVWDAKHIHHLEITALEKIDIEGRAAFYEETGALRDLIQSHLMQLVALLTMEEPAALSSSLIHQEKVALLKKIKPIAPDEVWRYAIRGQYEGYRQEVNNSDSYRETFAAIELSIDLPRWRNVPILIRTGKALSKKETRLVVAFRGQRRPTANSLSFMIQPSEGISLQLVAKTPGYEDQLQPVDMAFDYEQVFDDHGHPDAYERVLIDAIRGDHTLFSTSEEVLASWRALETIIKAWETPIPQLHFYVKGSNGPEEANQLAERHDTHWL